MKAHLFYVEDDESLSFVTRDNLELEGYQVTHCDNGQQAIEIVKNHDFDLCILDVASPTLKASVLPTVTRPKPSSMSRSADKSSL